MNFYTILELMIRNRQFLYLVLIFIVAFSLRFSLEENSFWVDEFSTAEQAKIIMANGFNTFTQTNNYFESNNILTHIITAFSFKILGVGVWQARVLMMIIGSVVPIFIYLLSRKLFDTATAISGSLLYTFSYWQITWARQARGYVMQQLFILAVLYMYQQLLQKYTHLKLLLFIILVFLGLLTHTTFVLIILAITIHFIIFYRSKITTHVYIIASLVFLNLDTAN